MVQDIKSWASKFKSLSDSDPTIAAMGKYYHLHIPVGHERQESHH